MKKTKFILLCLLTMLCMAKYNKVEAQNKNPQESDTSELTKKEKRQLIPKCYKLAVGVNSSKFRDFATSPLFYNGSVLQVGVSRLKIDDRRESETGILYDAGGYTANFNEISTVSKVKRAELIYSQLYRVNFLTLDKFNIKLGFLLSGTGNLRVNEVLQNNSAGIDIFANLLGSIKFTKDISRELAQEKKFLFLKYTKNARKRNLAFRLNLGLVNSSYRNGYVYANQSAVINDVKPFDGYIFKTFSGFRASTSLDYTCFLANKNAIQFSYVWDAYSTGGDLDKFEMGHHILKLALLFNTNNR